MRPQPDGENTQRSSDAGGSFAPFRHTAFTLIWIATVISNVGSWMYSAAAGWLMTGINPEPFVVALVQVATTLPMFLFALPAGALADIVDRRRFLIVAEVAVTLVSAIFAVLVWRGGVTANELLLCTFLTGIGNALAAPTWQAIVPQLVPKRDFPSAVTINGVGVNISRAVGPAFAGIVIAAWGIAAPFWLNAISNVGVIGVLLWWRSLRRRTDDLPAERFSSALRTGFRHARSNKNLRATLIRATGFFLFAGAYWAVLPLIARIQISGTPASYGLLLGAIGLGAVCGVFVLPHLRKLLQADGLATLGTIGTAVALCLFGASHELNVALVASLLAGLSWITALSSLNVSAQMALPDWVRGRGLAVFVTTFFGAITVGSIAWGDLAGRIGIPFTLYIAAAGALLTVPLTRRWHLLSGIGVDMAPSIGRWPAPVMATEIGHDRGPVLVTVEYQIRPADRQAFLSAIATLASQRYGTGAYDWGVYEDAAHAGRFVETFHVESWLEHLRQHERTTNADLLLQRSLGRFQLETTPKVSHFVAARMSSH